MNIDQACEQITLLKTVLETRNVDIGIRTLDQLIRFIESQQKTIEDMKCCGNCKYNTSTPNKNCYSCLNGGFDVSNNDNWELKQ